MRATLSVDAQVGWSRRPPEVVPVTTVPFALVGALFTTLDPTLPFFAVGYNEGEAATFDECATLFQDEQTVTSWSVQLAGSALSGSQTISFALVIDGVPDVTMPIDLIIGATGGIADGSLLIPAGSKVAVVATFGGGLVAKGVRGCILALDGVPFIVESTRIQTTASGIAIMGGANQATDGGDFEEIVALSPTVSGSIHPLPDNILVNGITLHSDTAPGAAFALTTRVSMGGATQATTTLPMGSQDVVNAAASFLWPETAVAADCNDAMAYHQGQAAVLNNVRVQIATRYVPSVPYEGFSIIVSSLNAGLATVTGADTENMNLILGGDSGTEVTVVPVRLLWPTFPGTFRHFVGYAKMSNAVNPVQIDFALEVDSIEQIMANSAAVQVNPVYVRNDADSFHVTGGELVQIVAHITGEDVQVRYGAAIGFLPD